MPALSDYAVALAKLLDIPVQDQVNRVSKLFAWLPKRPYTGKACDFTVEVGGRTVGNPDSGAAATAASTDTKAAASIAWGRYDTQIQLPFEVLTAERNNPANLVGFFTDEMSKGMLAVAKTINSDLYDGSAPKKIIGLDTICADQTTSYGGVDTGHAAWDGNDLFTGETMSVVKLDEAQEAVHDASGFELVPGDAIFMKSDLYRYLRPLLAADGGQRTIIDVSAGMPSGIRASGGAVALDHDGVAIYRDSDAPASYAYGLSRDNIELRYMPYSNPATGDVVMRPTENGEEPVMVTVNPLGRTGDSILIQLIFQLQLVAKRRNAHWRGNLSVL